MTLELCLILSGELDGSESLCCVNSTCFRVQNRALSLTNQVTSLILSFPLWNVCDMLGKVVGMISKNAQHKVEGSVSKWQVLLLHAPPPLSGSAGKESTCNAGDLSSIWIGKIPWRRERLPTLVFWPGELHGLDRAWGCIELDTTEQLSLPANLKVK